ncbi:hypothetical protein GOP47_0022881 [Adiantum capillus-veneris]|uniref:Uncharacterized protein n=1 Tax=Adiantum capillus-veneris TaxID=13818 RepID=A0A9D4U6N5_ADICA|nr:hypothetical protein GOP47_0022881 [Adiantum capillus-veneris]
MDQLALHELQATFPFSNQASEVKRRHVVVGDLRPPKGIVAEKACVDETLKSRKDLEEEKVRSQLKTESAYTVFTSWVATPPFGLGKEAISYTAGHCYKEKFGIHYSEADFKLNWVSGVGCFGSLVKPKDFEEHGVGMSKEPLALAYDDKEDFACFRIVDADDTAFLLPCSPTEVLQEGAQPYVATFGYPCIEYFLNHAYEELLERTGDYGIAHTYKCASSDPNELYRLLEATFGDFLEGQLLCSPGVLIGVEAGKLKKKSSTVEGSSGSPIIPVGLEGYTIGTHDAGSRVGDFNLATSTDSPGYVASYAKFVLPHLPSQTHPVWNARGQDLAPFTRWLTMRGLEWEQTSDGDGLKASQYGGRNG